MKIAQAASDDEIATARTLFEEYAQSLGFSLCFQNFDQELANLPSDYAPPTGRLLLLSTGDEAGGCVAFRKIDGNSCEMKRLFLRPGFRGKGLGRVLVEAAVQEARQLGYKRMRLDTVPGKDPAWDATQPDPSTSGVAPYRLYNIGNEQPVELLRYIEVLEQCLGRKATMELLPLQAGDVPETEADVSSLVAAVGYRPKVSVEEGIAAFVDWYRTYYAAAAPAAAVAGVAS